MSAASFDALDFYEKLVNAGLNARQARVFADCMKMQNEAHAATLRDYAEKQEKRAKEELATKTDISDVRLEMARMEVRLIKWILGVGISAVFTLVSILGAMLARGFGWW